MPSTVRSTKFFVLSVDLGNDFIPFVFADDRSVGGAGSVNLDDSDFHCVSLCVLTHQ